MAPLLLYVHRPFVEGGGRGGKGEWDASSIETYMVFGFKKTGVFSKVGVDGKERKLCETRGERGFPETKGMKNGKGEGLYFGPQIWLLSI